MKHLFIALALLFGIAPPSHAASVVRSKSGVKICPNGGGTVRANQRCPTLIVPQFSAVSTSVNEAAGTVSVHVTKLGGNNLSSTVTYSTQNGSASSSSDYTATSGTLTFAAGDTDKTVTVAITNDSIVENSETFSLNISAGTNARITQAQATVTIVDDDSAATTALAPLTAIADNFTTANAINPLAWGDGRLPSSMGVDPVGAFRMICGPGQLSYDDPIVFPGQHGVSHLHQFYGNLSANGDSTYASLRASGGSTCGDPNATIAVNRSGYWMPAMLDGAGHVVKPIYVAIYYKRIPASDPRCHPETNPDTAIGICTGIPTGLRFITGYNFQAGSNDAAALFYCQDSDDGLVRATASTIHSNMVAVIADCPAGARLTLNIDGPDCWDGVHLDSADHRTHVSHSTYFTNAGGVSVQKCDTGHPYHIPKVSIIAFYTVDSNFAAGNWKLSSDAMVSGAVPGTTFHADYWEAWSPGVRNTWQIDCIDGHLSCQGGELGDGTQIKGMTVPSGPSQLVAVP